jgi:hypothetical protein
MMYLILADFGGFALAKFALGKIESRDTPSRRAQTAIKLHCALKFIMGSSHKANREVGHVGGVVNIIGATCWRDGRRSKELLAKVAKMSTKSWAIYGWESQYSASGGRCHNHTTNPGAKSRYFRGRIRDNGGGSGRAITALVSESKQRLVQISGIVDGQRGHDHAIQAISHYQRNVTIAGDGLQA